MVSKQSVTYHIPSQFIFNALKISQKIAYNKIYYYLCTRNHEKTRLIVDSCPDGGIGRRVGLKHQWSNPCRFDPGLGHPKTLQPFARFFCFYIRPHTFSVASNATDANS